MNAMTISHVALWTKDLSASASFWNHYFSAEVGETYHSKRRPGFISCFITLPGCETKIELMTGPWLSPAQEPEHFGWDHVAISLGSRAAVDELAARCEKDRRLLSGPRPTGDGFYEAVIAAPDGTRIEITV
ncbi:VOC family protein [Caballeronia sp. J97]|uniref:VOC family protein n=1 Tax=Caballeronia sp. J97 TaxID=2805429 RepID=UPI002AB1E93F|nr:VOC family protein [Caballeronia sp. J97]